MSVNFWTNFESPFYFIIASTLINCDFTSNHSYHISPLTLQNSRNFSIAFQRSKGSGLA